MIVLLTLLVIALVMGGLPILAYLVMKFGTAGYIRAKQRQQKQNTTEHL